MNTTKAGKQTERQVDEGGDAEVDREEDSEGDRAGDGDGGRPRRRQSPARESSPTEQRS